MATVTQGTWANPILPGVNLPDLGLTELFANPGDKTFYNPSQDTSAKAGPTYQAQQAQKQSAAANTGDPINWQTTPTSAQAQNFIPQGYNTNAQGTVVQSDVNRYDPNNLIANGINFGSDRAAYEAYKQQQELGPQLDAVYNPQFDYLNQTEQFYKNQLPGYQQEAQSNYDVNKQILNTGLANTNTNIQNQETKGQRATEDAAAKARRIFQEQQIGGQQRFGGSSSAGGAYSELLARNLQSEQGQIGRQAVDYTQQIGQMRQQAQQKFDDSVMQLEQQKQKALTDIQREFDQKMLEITNNRTQLTSAKAQAKLQALMDLRNQTFAIQQQEAQFKQALQLQLMQNQQTAQAGVGSLNSLQAPQTPQGLGSYGVQTSGAQASAATPYSQYTGAISTSRRPDEMRNSIFA